MEITDVQVHDILILVDDLPSLGMKKGTPGVVLGRSIDHGTVLWKPTAPSSRNSVWLNLNRFRREENAVDNPAHYTAGGIETIAYIEAKLSPEEYRGYLKGQVMKYISRAGKKHDEAEDLGKAAWYLERLRRLVGEQRGEVRGPEGQPGPDRTGS